MALNWRTWCHLCGDFENIERTDLELQQITEKLIEVSLTPYICFDCKNYIQDLRRFKSKAHLLQEMFCELRSKDTVTDDELLLMRKTYNLRLPKNGFNEVVDAGMDLGSSETMWFEPLPVGKCFGFDPVEGGEFYEIEGSLVTEGLEFGFGSTFEEILEGAVEEQLTSDLGGEDEPESDQVSENFSFNCHICSEKFTKMSFLSVHTRTAHGCSPSVKCKCGSTITSSKCLIEHYNDHVSSTSVKFRCNQCDKGYKTKAHFIAHMATHGDEKVHVCHCGKAFKKERQLQAHSAVHLPLKTKPGFIHTCHICQKKYSSVFVLRQHIRHVHTSAQAYHCEFCDKTFNRKANLTSHVTYVHTDEKNFECDICGMRAKTKGTLREHGKIHMLNPEVMLECEVCQKKFKTRSQLSNHKISHSDVKRHKCKQCPAEYKRSKDLTAHIDSVHTGIAKYHCPWCPNGRSFFSNSNFRKHKLKFHLDMLPESERGKHFLASQEIE